MKKICTKCNIEKLLREFNKQIPTKDGLAYRCKSCHKKYREENREEFTEKHRIYVSKNKKKVYKINRKWLAKNPDYDKEYYANNREKRSQQAKKRYLKRKNKIN